MNETYKVWLVIEKIDEAKDRRRKIENPLESAAVQTVEEAQMFCRELAQQFSARATGEVELLEEMIIPDPQATLIGVAADDSNELRR